MDRLPERLELAKTLGATGVINTVSENVNIVEEVRAMTNSDGSSVTIDTTGNMDLIRASLEFTASRGQLIFVGVPPPEALLDVHIITFMQVRILKI